jgi:hypothetical protein
MQMVCVFEHWKLSHFILQSVEYFGACIVCTVINTIPVQCLGKILPEKGYVSDASKIKGTSKCRLVEHCVSACGW